MGHPGSVRTLSVTTLYNLLTILKNDAHIYGTDVCTWTDTDTDVIDSIKSSSKSISAQ
jgi:hypothetical protein